MTRALRFLLAMTSFAACTGGETPPGSDGGTAADAGIGDEWPEQDQRGEEPLGLAWDMPEVTTGGFTVLSANVGNIDVLHCGAVSYKLCVVENERAIIASIARLSPDVVLLQEVLNPAQCAELSSVDETHVCHPSNTAAEPDQARRLVGAGYTVSCEPRNGYECIAVKVGAGSIDGCADGQLCRGHARVAPPIADCEPGFTIAAVTATLGGVTFDLVSGHPPSSNAAAAQDCRVEYMKHVLDRANPQTLLENDRVVMGGDFNMDPWRGGSAYPDVTYWRRFVSPTLDEADHPWTWNSGILEHDPPYWSSPITRRTLDHVASQGVIGRCLTLGAAEDHPPLDRAIGDELQRLDHLGLWCRLAPRT